MYRSRELRSKAYPQCVCIYRVRICLHVWHIHIGAVAVAAACVVKLIPAMADAEAGQV